MCSHCHWLLPGYLGGFLSSSRHRSPPYPKVPGKCSKRTKAVEFLRPRLQNLYSTAMFNWSRLVTNLAQVQGLGKLFPGIVPHIIAMFSPVTSDMYTTNSCYLCSTKLNSEIIPSHCFWRNSVCSYKPLAQNHHKLISSPTLFYIYLRLSYLVRIIDS